MFVKKYYQFNCYLHSLDAWEIFWRDDYYEEYEENNYGYSRGHDDFVERIKAGICDVTFSYFSELKPKESTLRPMCEKIIEEETALWLYKHLFDLIFDFYAQKEFEWEVKEWAYEKIKTDEEIEQEAEDFVKTYNIQPEDANYVKELTYNSEKNSNHFNGYKQLLHKTILRCVTSIFEEIPELPSNMIRYINYITHRNMRMLHSELFEIIADDLISPYEE